MGWFVQAPLTSVPMWGVFILTPFLMCLTVHTVILLVTAVTMTTYQGQGGGFSLRVLSTKLRGGDTSHDAIVDQVDKELREADAQLKEAQDQLE